MKYILLLICMFSFFSCNGNTETSISTETASGMLILDDSSTYYDKTAEITFSDEDVAITQKKLAELEKKDNLSRAEFIEKVRYIEYLGRLGEALKMYIENYENDDNYKDIAYNHNLAVLYEKVGDIHSAHKLYEYTVEQLGYETDRANLERLSEELQK